jgi:hypothetical protein
VGRLSSEGLDLTGGPLCACLADQRMPWLRLEGEENLPCAACWPIPAAAAGLADACHRLPGGGLDELAPRPCRRLGAARSALPPARDHGLVPRLKQRRIGLERLAPLHPQRPTGPDLRTFRTPGPCLRLGLPRLAALALSALARLSIGPTSADHSLMNWLSSSAPSATGL